MRDIRLARPQDVASLRSIVQAAFAPYLERMDREPTPMSADYEALVEAGEVWVATHEGELVGVVTLRVEGGHALLATLAVRPALGGTGLGTQLSSRHGRRVRPGAVRQAGVRSLIRAPNSAERGLGWGGGA